MSLSVLLENMRSVVNQVVNSSKSVKIDFYKAKKFVNKIADCNYVLPKLLEETQNAIMKELVANSVNYCYWYGKYNLRPSQASANTMYACLERAEQEECPPIFNFDRFVGAFYDQLCEKRFTLLSERHKHLSELTQDRMKINRFIALVINNSSAIPAFEFLVNNFPGYADDILLKRAQLLISQLHKQVKRFDDMFIFTVFADYQLPNVLRYHKIISYSKDLRKKIDNSTLIHKGSIEEIEIRCATVKVCDAIAISSNLDSYVIDELLWEQRHCPKTPFHLTITSDY